MQKEEKIGADGLVEWRPVWTGDELDHYNTLRADIRPRLSLVRDLRELLNLTQKDVADLLETTQSSVSKIEAKADPSLSVLRRIIEGRGGKLKLVIETEEGKRVELAA